MTLLVVPVRYPLSKHSKKTLAEAIDIAEDRDASLTILHVDLYHDSHNVSRRDLKRAVEREFGPLADARYVVRKGFIVEETILSEVAAEGADIVVIGEKQVSRWRQTVRRLIGDPDIEYYLRGELDCEVVTAT